MATPLWTGELRVVNSSSSGPWALGLGRSPAQHCPLGNSTQETAAPAQSLLNDWVQVSDILTLGDTVFSAAWDR